MRVPVLLGCIVLAGAGARAQPAEPGAIGAISGRDTQLGYYASFRPDCTAAPLPEIRVTRNPQHGLVIVRRSTIKTKRVTGCALAEGPVLLVLYRSRSGFVGRDAIAFDVVDASGRVRARDIVISVTEGPGGRSLGSPIDL